MKQALSRRRFIKVSALAAGALAAGGCALPQPRPRLISANEKINIAMIGVGGQGLSRLKEALQNGVNIVALCDVDEKMMAAARQATAATLGHPNTYVDFRKMLEAEKVLTVSSSPRPTTGTRPFARRRLTSANTSFAKSRWPTPFPKCAPCAIAPPAPKLSHKWATRAAPPNPCAAALN